MRKAYEEGRDEDQHSWCAIGCRNLRQTRRSANFRFAIGSLKRGCAAEPGDVFTARSFNNVRRDVANRLDPSDNQQNYA
jgi:hypothetical protein